MGSYPHTYVGCYIQFDYKELEEGEQIVTYESEAGEVFEEEFYYSPITGDPLHKKVKTISKSHTIKHLYDLDITDDQADEWSGIPEFACPVGKGVIIPNQSEKFSFSLEENEVQPIDFYTETAIDAFMEKHKDFIEFLKQRVDNVQVHLGVVNYRH